MGSLLNKVQYTSPDNGQPFRLTLAAGYIAVNEGSRSIFVIEQTSNVAIYATVEGTVTSGELIINRIIDSTVDPIPLFVGGVTIKSALDSVRLSEQQGEGRTAWAILGQSNASAQNGTEISGSAGYNPILDAPDPQILQLRKSTRFTNDDHTVWFTDSEIADKYVLATDPLDHAQDAGNNVGAVRENSVGFGLTFAKEWKRRNMTLGNRQLVLLPAARGGTALISASAPWHPPTGSMYLYAISLINEFLDEHPDNKLEGVIFQQGESDALTNTITGFNWGTQLLIIINNFRNGGVLNPTVRQPSFENLPFIIGGIKTTGTSNQINHASDVATVVSTTPYTGSAPPRPTSEWNYFEFGLHLDAIGQREWGLIMADAYDEAMDNLPALPTRASQVQDLVATQDPGVVHLGWTALAVQDPVITNYGIQYKETSAGAETYSSVTLVGSGVLSADINLLTNGTSYTFRVFGVSAAGTGIFATVIETPAIDTVPTAVQNLAAVQSVPGITLTWDALVFDPLVSGYTVQRKVSTDPTFNSGDDVDLGLVTTYDFTTPTNGITYDFRVFAVNAIGDGSPSTEASVTFASSPTAALAPVMWLQKSVGQTGDGAGNLITWADQSGNGNDATTPNVQNYPTLNGDGSVATTNTSDKILALDPTALVFQNRAFTMVFDVFKDNANAQDYLYESRNGYRIWTLSGGRIQILDRFTSNGVTTPTSFFTAGTRFQVAVTVTATGTYTIYNASGTSVVQNTGLTLDSNGERPSLLGLANNSAYTSVVGEFDGSMYNFVAFDFALTGAEIASVIGEFA